MYDVNAIIDFTHNFLSADWVEGRLYFAGWHANNCLLTRFGLSSLADTSDDMQKALSYFSRLTRHSRLYIDAHGKGGEDIIQNGCHPGDANYQQADYRQIAAFLARFLTKAEFKENHADGNLLISLIVCSAGANEKEEASYNSFAAKLQSYLHARFDIYVNIKARTRLVTTSIERKRTITCEHDSVMLAESRKRQQIRADLNSLFSPRFQYFSAEHLWIAQAQRLTQQLQALETRKTEQKEWEEHKAPGSKVYLLWMPNDKVEMFDAYEYKRFEKKFITKLLGLFKGRVHVPFDRIEVTKREGGKEVAKSTLAAVIQEIKDGHIYDTLINEAPILQAYMQRIGEPSPELEAFLQQYRTYFFSKKIPYKVNSAVSYHFKTLTKVAGSAKPRGFFTASRGGSSSVI